jgi:hypothetical protein
VALSCGLLSVGLVFDRAQTPAPGVRPFDSSGRESLKNLLGLRLECRAMVAMIAFRP